MKLFIAFDIIGPNGYIPYVYNKKTLPNVMEYEIKSTHNNDYFNGTEKVSSYQLLNNPNAWNEEHTYLIPISWQLENTPISEILSPDFLKFVNSKENIFIIYTKYDYDYESQMYSLI
jgi:hypothetical protein